MILLILPCNKGAKEGNYYPYGAWKQALRLIKKNKITKNLVDFAAVDSIITKMNPTHDKETKDSIVLENEMNRVKNYDLFPKWNLFSRNNYEFLKEHTRYCEIGLRRIIDKYELIIVAIAVKGYKYAMIRAIRNLYNGNIPEKFVVIDSGESPSYQNSSVSYAIRIIMKYLNREFTYHGKIIKPENILDTERFLKRPKDIPNEFIYWKLPFYISQNME